MNFFTQNALIFIHEAFSFAGVAIIVVGALYTLYHFIMVVADQKRHVLNLAHLRIGIGCSIILGLDFMVAADVVQTVLAPDYYELGILGSLVVIRIILSYFLTKEINLLRGK